MKQNKILADFITSQYDLKKLEEIVKAFLQLVETAQLVLTNSDYYIRITPSYEMRIAGESSVRPVSSKVESFIINKYDTTEKLEELILKYPIAFNSLIEIEKKLFKMYFIEEEKRSVIQDELLISAYTFDITKKSLIVKFCLVLGLDKYIDRF